MSTRLEAFVHERSHEPTGDVVHAETRVRRTRDLEAQRSVGHERIRRRQTEAVRIAAATLPRGSWRIDPVEVQGRWMVYIGKLADADAVATKRAEVRALGVDTDRPGPGFEPGLSLGRFSSEEAAQRALTDLARKGVRTAHVVQERGNAPAFVLRLPAADAALREQLRALRPVFAGRDVRPCN